MPPIAQYRNCTRGHRPIGELEKYKDSNTNTNANTNRRKCNSPDFWLGKKKALQKRGGEGIWLHWMVGEKEGRRSRISWPACALFSLMLMMMMTMVVMMMMIMCCYCYTSFTPPTPFSLCSCRNIARPFLLLNHCIMG